MLKLPDNLSIPPGPSPVGRVMPALGLEGVATAIHELAARANQFERGREYVAQVLSRLDDKTHLVKIDNTVLKMELGNTAQTGQTINLRFVQHSPIPTFLFSTPQAEANENTPQLSQAARLIGQYLQEAENKGVSARFEASVIVTQQPQNAALIAQGLRQAVVNSGLFYEAHLNEMAKGARTVAALLQEPQNQQSAQIPALTAQQLTMLEHQRLYWHGQAWPGQTMDWDVYAEEREHEEAGQQSESESRPFVSELTLHLPRLGKVSAKLRVVDTHVTVELQAKEAQTFNKMQQSSAVLKQAIADSGLALDMFRIAQHE
ncbi:MAG: flagellar hook-length control protein FliK [Betaproteobacteria bacterium HGW-Betaproteobacteria-22]|nr:MAG: flagellar hook-length control protein FliK [Betaproteobacteria bacterium HGW-Betaproteobacteria-22]